MHHADTYLKKVQGQISMRTSIMINFVKFHFWSCDMLLVQARVPEHFPAASLKIDDSANVHAPPFNFHDTIVALLAACMHLYTCVLSSMVRVYSKSQKQCHAILGWLASCIALTFL